MQADLLVLPFTQAGKPAVNISSGFTYLLEQDLRQQIRRLDIPHRGRVQALLGRNPDPNKLSTALVRDRLGAKHVISGQYRIRGEQIIIHVNIHGFVKGRCQSTDDRGANGERKDSGVVHDKFIGSTSDMVGLRNDIVQSIGLSLGYIEPPTTEEDIPPLTGLPDTVAEVEQAPAGKLEDVETFSRAVDAYDDGNLDEALSVFQSLIVKEPAYNRYTNRFISDRNKSTIAVAAPSNLEGIPGAESVIESVLDGLASYGFTLNRVNAISADTNESAHRQTHASFKAGYLIEPRFRLDVQDNGDYYSAFARLQLELVDLESGNVIGNANNDSMSNDATRSSAALNAVLYTVNDIVDKSVASTLRSTFNHASRQQSQTTVASVIALRERKLTETDNN